MDKTGVDFFLDVHGDESIPYVFLSGADVSLCMYMYVYVYVYVYV